MRILFDHQAFCLQPYGGVSRYFAELMSHLSVIDGVEPVVSTFLGSNYHLRQISRPRPRFVTPHDLCFYGRSVALGMINRPFTVAALMRRSFDVFHPTYYSPYFLRWLGRKPFVLTIFDMIHEVCGSPDRATTVRKGLLVKKAAKIIAISEHTKRDIVKVFGVDEGKITVVHLASSIQPLREPPLGLDLPSRYVLYVGGRDRYKNFSFFVEAVAGLLASDSGLHLVCAGGREFEPCERRQFRDLGLDARVHRYPGDDRSLACLYQNALVFVFPSLYEGFGLPIVEAFSCGCPVAAGNAGSLPEVAGEAAVYFNPRDKGQILKAVKGVVEDGALNRDLRARGYERVRMFSWEDTARKTAEVYRAASE
jgi:glycosyltransferase involved in cell wall biosynthesis